jgi:hypothetical protein
MRLDPQRQKVTKTMDLRTEYRMIRNRSHAQTRENFNAAVRAHLGDKADTATPAEWVAAAKATHIRCRRCAGTGDFITMVENGVPRGPGGICYRCAGKGYQTDEDAVRNAIADRFYFGRAA